MTRLGAISTAVLLVLSTACSDFTGAGPDPGKAGMSEGRRVAIVARNIYAGAITVDDTRLYAVTGGSIESFAKNGTDERRLAEYTQGGGSSAIVQFSEDLFVRGQNGGIILVPKGGGDAVVFVDSTQAPGAGAIAVDASGVYYVAGQNLMHAGFPSGTPEVFGSNANSGGPQGTFVAVDPAYVYYVAYRPVSSGPNQSVLVAVAKADHTSTDLVTTNGQITGIAAAGGVVYYTDSVMNATTTGTLHSVDPTTGSATEIDANLKTNGGNSAVIAADTEAVYFGAGIGLERIAVDGSGSSMLVTSASPISLAIDDTWIYWVDQNSNGWILKIRK